jgi:cytochrome c oxidase subunit II
MRGWPKAAASALLPALMLTGCAGGEQSALRGDGTRAEAINENTWFMIILGTIVWVIVTAAVLYALGRRRRRAPAGEAHRNETLTVIVGGLVLPAVIIVVVAAHAIKILDEIDPRDVSDDAMVIEVIGHQYWWEVRYPDEDIVTANEVHIPAGERVKIELASDDVIHSFWLPALTGKMDMIPGRVTETWVESDRPGTYWGQCAEYCGLQHARMRFVAVVHEQEEFAAWAAAQREPAADVFVDGVEDPDEEIVRGRQVFMGSSCVYCHTIAGTEATGRMGPDLTHFASRETIGAGTLDNNRGNLGGWIVDPHARKAGVQMPATDMPESDLQALLTYLESLE